MGTRVWMSMPDVPSHPVHRFLSWVASWRLIVELYTEVPPILITFNSKIGHCCILYMPDLGLATQLTFRTITLYFLPDTKLSILESYVVHWCMNACTQPINHIHIGLWE